MEEMTWQCAPSNFPYGMVHFCHGVLNYEPAVPNPNTTTTIDVLIKELDNAALTSYFYHLSAMGLDPWEYKTTDEAAEHDDCIRSVRAMVCNTYFPKAEAGCQPGQRSSYRRPCGNACQNYLNACSVECCDEGPTCIFEHQARRPVLDVGSVNERMARLLQTAQRAVDTAAGDATFLQLGYVNAEGPSTMCTGAAGRSASTPVALIIGLLGLQLFCAGSDGQATKSDDTHKKRKTQCPHLANWILAGLFLIIASCLHGCDASEGLHHSEANWRQETSYMNRWQLHASGASSPAGSGNWWEDCTDGRSGTPCHIGLGEGTQLPVVNSCLLSDQIEQVDHAKCSGNGYCRPFNDMFPLSAGELTFCQCNKGWADPECSTKRQSQLTTFLLSIFVGFTGADLYYLGCWQYATLKLLTLGGGGFWWVYDVIRTGSAPVYSCRGFRVEADLNYWVYLVLTIAWLLVISFTISILTMMSVRRSKRAGGMHMNAKEEANSAENWKYEDLDGTKFWGTADSRVKPPIMQRSFQGYGAPLPALLHNAGAPYAASFYGSTGASTYHPGEQPVVADAPLVGAVATAAPTMAVTPSGSVATGPTAAPSMAITPPRTPALSVTSLSPSQTAAP